MPQQTFKEQKLIYTSTGWCGPCECVWKGPAFLSETKVLSDIHGTPSNAAKFFMTFLSMRDANHSDVLEELKARSNLRQLPSHFVEQMPEIYKTLAGMARAESAVEAVR
jgi:hypothetical protein